VLKVLAGIVNERSVPLSQPRMAKSCTWPADWPADLRDMDGVLRSIAHASKTVAVQHGRFVPATTACEVVSKLKAMSTEKLEEFRDDVEGYDVEIGTVQDLLYNIVYELLRLTIQARTARAVGWTYLNEVYDEGLQAYEKAIVVLQTLALYYAALSNVYAVDGTAVYLSDLYS
jgi:hypothetical protein